MISSLFKHFQAKHNFKTNKFEIQKKYSTGRKLGSVNRIKMTFKLPIDEALEDFSLASERGGALLFWPL